MRRLGMLNNNPPECLVEDKLSQFCFANCGTNSVLRFVKIILEFHQMSAASTNLQELDQPKDIRKCGSSLCK